MPFKTPLRHLEKLWAIFFLLALLAAPGAPGQAKLSAKSGADESADSKSSNTVIDSPRFMMRQFMDVIKRDDLDQAINFIEFPRRMSMQRQRAMVRQLVDVINKRGQIDVTQISNDPNGKLMDGLLPDAEIIGNVVVDGVSVPIELRRSPVPEDGRRPWRFAAEFVEKIPNLAERIDESGLDHYMPSVLVEYSWLDIKVWQWLGLGIALLLSLLFSTIFAYVLIKVINLSTRRFWVQLSDRALKRMVPPLRWITGILVFQLATNFLEMKLSVRQSLQYLESVVLTLSIAFLLMRMIEAFIELSRLNFEKQGRPQAGGMLQPIQKGAKVLVVTCALIWVFRDLGFDVTAIIAGLGVGGLAIALAGQKTIENLFGGVSVLLDQPVRVGDAGRFGDIVGTVEDIGLRSTKVRTLDRTLVTIPNAEFSLMKIENYERRDKMRWSTQFGLRYDTRPAQMRLILMRMKELLIGHPMVINDPARVRFTRLGASSLDIDIFCFIRTSDQNEYLSVVEDLNLKLMEIVDEGGSSFAYPSSTVYLEKSEGLNPDKVARALEEAQKIHSTVGFPQPKYPQEWIEPREDILTFGPSK